MLLSSHQGEVSPRAIAATQHHVGGYTRSRLAWGAPASLALGRAYDWLSGAGLGYGS